MLASSLLPCLVIASFIGGGGAFEWIVGSPEDQASVFTCDGDNVTLSWNFALDTDTQRLLTITWYTQGHVVASYAGGHFFTDNSHVQHVPLAGLKVNGVKVNTTWSVTVHVANSSVLTSYNRTVHVLPPEAAQVYGGVVEVEAEPSVMMEEVSGQWLVELRCGHFITLGHPPVTVSWKKPSGQVVASSGFDQGSFVLKMNPEHVDTGNYTCLLDTTSAGMPCLAPQVLNASVFVDGPETLVKVLEEEQGVLGDGVHQMTSRLHHGLDQLQSLKSNVTTITSLLSQCLASKTSTSTTPESTTTTMAATTTPTTTASTTTTTQPSTTTTHSRTTSAECRDNPDLCMYATRRDCQDDYFGTSYQEHCPKTCGVCQQRTTTTSTTTTRTSQACADHADFCVNVGVLDCFDETDGDYFRLKCPKTCGACQPGGLMDTIIG